MKAILGEGMPTYRHQDFGNLYIKFEVDFPSPNWTDAETIAQLEKILPARQPLPPIKDAHVEEVVLSLLDASQQNRMANGAQGAMDEDEEGQGGPGMQCAQQ
ncbi:DNAJA2 [Jimgerdemannia flammicorona]|nr:DNAJA2 [Jimgerdemannia flammicorona]